MRETGLIRTYRALLRGKGVTNGEFIHSLGLGAVYRSRISEVRAEMYAKFGRSQDWIPCEVVSVTPSATITRFKLVIPEGANERDPLNLLGDRITPEYDPRQLQLC